MDTKQLETDMHLAVWYWQRRVLATVRAIHKAEQLGNPCGFLHTLQSRYVQAQHAIELLTREIKEL